MHKSQLNRQNVKIVRPDVMTGVRTPVPPLMCEFIMALPFRLSTKKKSHSHIFRFFEVETLSFISSKFKPTRWLFSWTRWQMIELGGPIFFKESLSIFFFSVLLIKYNFFLFVMWPIGWTHTLLSLEKLRIWWSNSDHCILLSHLSIKLYL